MKPNSSTGNRGAPAFPIRTVIAGIALMVAIAIASAVTTWSAGNRIRTVTSSQIEVLTATVQLQHQSELLELLATMAIATGDERHARRYGNVQPQLRRALARLRVAMQLPENRATFVLVERAEREISAIEYQALDLAVSDRREEARQLLESPRYTRLVRAYRSGITVIAARSRAYTEATRIETNRYLTINFASSMVALLLIGLAWLVLVRPAQTWAKQLGEARRRAESATAAKSDFLAVMSHEVRTPLNSIIGFADLLLTDGAVKGEQRRQVGLIQGAGAMLLTVVNDLLDFSKIEAGRIELTPEPFALEALVDNSVSIVRSSAEAKGLEMRVEIDPCLSTFFIGDENRIRQVLLNLLNNAVKFTAEGLVSLAVAKAGEEGDRERIRFTVTDTGVGIDPAGQKQLFEPFSQADASITRKYGGTGLGLSISKRLVELMGGEIGFQSKPGSGSSFWFWVELPRAEQLAALEGGSLGQSGPSGATILVVEDLVMNQELARAMLGRAGHQVDIAADGEQAVKAVQERSYDLVLMDIQMPRMDGITATRVIRKLPPPVGKVPIVAMTANVLPHQVVEFLAAGMNGHVAKPVRQRELEAAIAAALPGNRRSLQAPVAEQPQEEAAFDAETFRQVLEAIPAERLRVHAADLDGMVLSVAAADAHRDPEGTAATAHKIVTQAGMLGLMRLSARAREVEEAVRDGADTDAALARFRSAAPDVGIHLLPLLTGGTGTKREA